MIPYLIVFFTVSVFGFIIDFVKSQYVKLLALFFTLITFLSLYYYRDYNIGTDTLNYVPIFEDVFRTNNLLEYTVISGIEFGFTAAVYFLSLFSKDHFFIFVTLTAIIYINLLAAFYRYKLSATLFFASLFCVFPAYFYSFNILRQMIALSFVILAVSFLLREKNKHFFLFCFLAFSFHYSSIFVVLFYFIYQFRYLIVRFWYFAVFGAFAVVYVFFGYIVSSFDKYSGYAGVDEVTSPVGTLLNLFYISIFFIALYLKKYISFLKSDFYFFLATYGFFVSLSLYFMLADALNQGMVRASLYFIWPAVFLVLIIIKNIFNINMRYIVSCLYYLFLFSFTAYYLSNAGPEVVPYRFR